jgi:hypothetical protein
MEAAKKKVGKGKAATAPPSPPSEPKPEAEPAKKT